MISMEFVKDALINCEGRSCNVAKTDVATVGVIFYGEKGSLQINGDNSYRIYDLNSKVIKEVKTPKK